jgi:hypothetical protein
LDKPVELVNRYWWLCDHTASHFFSTSIIADDPPTLVFSPSLPAAILVATIQ